MKNKFTFKRFAEYTVSVLALNASENAGEMVDGGHVNFTVEPSVTQTLYLKAAEAVDFLAKINLIQVIEIKGEKLGLDASGLVMRRSDLSNGKRRVPKDMSTLYPNTYECVEVEFDTGIKWSKLDIWAKFADFFDKISQALIITYASNLMMVGFNGTHYAPITDPTVNKLGEDIAKGWLQKVREDAPDRHMEEDAPDSGKVRYGPYAPEYKNLDAVVVDAINTYLPSWAQEADLVVICSRRLLGDKYFKLVNDNDKPTEIQAMQTILATKRLGNLPAYGVPYFPSDKILITTFENLSIYEQEGSRRRKMSDDHDWKGYVDLQTTNLDFVIEDYDYICLIENLEEMATEPAPVGG